GSQSLIRGGAAGALRRIRCAAFFFCSASSASSACPLLAVGLPSSPSPQLPRRFGLSTSVISRPPATAKVWALHLRDLPRSRDGFGSLPWRARDQPRQLP